MTGRGTVSDASAQRTAGRPEQPVLERRSDDFRLPADIHYLNCAYMSPLPGVVEDAGIEGMRRKRRPHEITPADFFSDSDELRAAFDRLIGGDDPSRVAIIPSVSYGITVASRNLQPDPGSRVVLVAEQFPSHVYPWRRLASERDLQVVTVRAPETAGSRGAAWNEAVLEAVGSDVSIVALPHYHWMDGTRFDLAEIGRRARAVGAALVVDGTQSVGAAPFDVDAVRPDAVVCAGYKWLLGPYGIGVGWYGPRFDDGVPLEETWASRVGSDDFRRVAEYRDDYRPGAARYDVGERSNFIAVPMQLAAIRKILEWKPERIQAYCGNLADMVADEATSLGIQLEDRAWRGQHLFGLRLPPGMDAAALGPELQRRRVSVSLRGSAVRVAPHVYNGPEDVEALLEAVRATLG